jgi:membrane-associated phospholipid phosphatase
MKTVNIFLFIFFVLCHFSFASIYFENNQLDILKDSIRDTISVSRSGYNPYEVKLDKNYIKSYWYDTKAVVTSPLHWKGKDFLLAGITLAGTVGLYMVDQNIRDWSQVNQTRESKVVSSIFEPLGNGRYLMITSGAVFLTGVVLKSKRAQKAGLLILESQLINGVLGQVLKISASRHRPRDGARYNVWDGPNLTPNSSFPSGHAQTVFAFSTAIATVYADHKWVPPICYGVAALTSLSRIHDDAHWSSDVFFGSVLGYFMTKTIVNRHVNRENPKLSAMPILGGNFSGLKISYFLD